MLSLRFYVNFCLATVELAFLAYGLAVRIFCFGGDKNNMNFNENKESYFMVIASKLAVTRDNRAFFDLKEFKLDRREDTRAAFVDWLNSFNNIKATTRARAIVEISATKEFLDIYGE